MIKKFPALASVLLAVIVTLSSFTPATQPVAEEEIKWMSFEEAVAASRKNPKKLLIDVYTDWCGWCKKLDNVTYKDPALVKYVNKNYYSVKLDAEMKDTVVFNNHTFVNPNPDKGRSSHELAISLLGGQMSYPTTVILDEGFNLVTQPVKGYLDAPSMLQILKFFGDNAYKTSSWEEYQKQDSK